jgi:hypothetical protein
MVSGTTWDREVATVNKVYSATNCKPLAQSHRSDQPTAPIPPTIDERIDGRAVSRELFVLSSGRVSDFDQWISQPARVD